MVGNHYVLVTDLGLDGEVSGVIGVEALKRKLAKMQFRHLQLLRRWRIDGHKHLTWSGWLHRMHVLLCLVLVALDGGIGARTVACG